MDEYYKEIERLTKIVSQFVIQIYNYWPFDNKIYISMEYCSQSLKSVLKIKGQVFERQSGQPMDCIEYYISCEIMREMCECVQYLHSNAIIHRDLKPDNILIAHNVINGRFVKLCDFGLIKVIEIQSQSNTLGVGTPKYMAPEIYRHKKYNTKVDVYSIGIIAQDLFDIDINV